METHVEVVCLDCGHIEPFHPLTLSCSRCQGSWQEARYDLPAIAPVMRQEVSGRPFDLWRYLELLPIRSMPSALAMGEGGTPLIRASNLGEMFGLANLFIKDERQGPTASFKDRQAALTVAVLKEAGIREAVVASTGNVAIAYSAYCSRGGVKLWAFLTSLVPAEKMHEVAIYGTQVVKVTSTYDQAKRMAGEFAAQRGLYLDRGTRSVAAVESMKTIAFEVAEQLARMSPPGGDGQEKKSAWLAPDWYIQAVSGGIGPWGVLKGFSELRKMGYVQRMPAIAGIQTSGCAPMAEAWRNGAEAVTPVESPSTHISTLSTGDPGRTYTLLRKRMLGEGGGLFASVSDEEAYRAMHIGAKTEGLSMEPAAAVAFAGLFKLAQEGVIRRDDVVVVNCSGHAMPVEKDLLGEGWSRDLELAPMVLPESPQEGLLSALAYLDGRRTHQVLVVDDHLEARRLIRRILQAQGDFEVREAASGPEALAEARRSPPDLLILDLMMPEMDGFAVLDQLKQQPQTSNIPVIVVTAKELTVNEKKRLQGQIAQLMTKGDFLNMDLLEEIMKVLG